MASKDVERARARASRPALIRRTLVVLLVVGAAIAAAVLEPVRLGLDLRGGTQVVLEARSTDEIAIEGETVDRTLEVLRRRIDTLGVAEPTIQRSGDARIIIELPGVSDPEEAMAVIGRTAQLTFHPVEEVVPDAEPDLVAGDEPDARLAAGGVVLLDDSGVPIRLGASELDGDAVGTAGIAVAMSGASRFDVTIEFRGEGARAWQQLTAEAACAPPGDPQRRVAIVLDNEVISSPQVAPDVACGQGIGGGSTVITGDFTEDEARELSLLIRGGALPVPVEVIERSVIGPTLGATAIEASVTAALIGVLLTLLFMVAAYRLFGLVAGLGLAVYALLAYAALAVIGATLTLPGIAGFVLAVGMAVDANVLIFERAKEEFAGGHKPRGATGAGFQRAFSAVVDSNVTTLIAAVLLIFFASGAVRGFGVTLSIGVAVSMFSALVVVRVVVEWLLRSRKLAHRPDVMGLTAWQQLRRWLDEHQPDVMGRSRWWLTAAAVAVVLSVAGIATQGLTWGLEFTGGRLLEYRTEQPVDVDALRTDITGADLPPGVVQSTAEGQVSIRTPELDERQEATLLGLLEARGGQLEVVRDEFIGPSLGAELRRNALIALGIALTGQLLYLAVRFRWTYGTAAVAGMVHDALLLIGLFAWLGKTFDGVFLAALLTVIGYSINDTVVIFDRVRERRTAEPKRPLPGLANQAVTQTLPRTVNTGLGALFILVALFVLGGDTLADFALALIIGTTVGMYSSLVVAPPVWLWLEKRAPTKTPPQRHTPTKRTGDRAVV
jgi:SecD/SecF fusion protein